MLEKSCDPDKLPLLNMPFEYNTSGILKRLCRTRKFGISRVQSFCDTRFLRAAEALNTGRTFDDFFVDLITGKMRH